MNTLLQVKVRMTGAMTLSIRRLAKVSEGTALISNQEVLTCHRYFTDYLVPSGAVETNQNSVLSASEPVSHGRRGEHSRESNNLAL